uniref:Uncharacterized protein n=1 Tax=Setaria italica TaxID=4555 RepID=K3Y2Z7_SETIT
MAGQANRAGNFDVVPPQQQPGFIDPYDVCDMEEADEDETEELKKFVFAWLQDHGHTREFGAHVSVIAFSPISEPKAYGAPTVDSVLRTYLPEIHSSPSPVCSEMAGKAIARVDGMKWEAEETAFLTEAERACQAAAWSKILATQMSVGK